MAISIWDFDRSEVIKLKEKAVNRSWPQRLYPLGEDGEQVTRQLMIKASKRQNDSCLTFQKAT